MAYWKIRLASLLAIIMASANADQPSETGQIALEQAEEKKAMTNHEKDSLNLLIYMALLILTVLTIWLFKHRRFRFVHETGLGIIYGLVVGVIIRYGSSMQNQTAVSVVAPENYTHHYPPDSIKLAMKSMDMENQTNTKWYRYSFSHPLDSMSGGDIQLEDKATFDPEVFFNVLLPPIIFNAGYSMKRRHFFRNFGAIVTYAFLGTAISCFVVGAVLFGITRFITYPEMGFNNCLYFGALISATDPVTVLAIFHDLNVDVDLYALVFGESVLNDAVAIVLAGAIDNYGKSNGGSFDGMEVLRSLGSFLGVFFGAFAMGSGMGCATAILTKFTHIRDYPLLETSLFFLMSYSTFLAAEAAEMTGIVAVLFCGICQAHYTYNNLSLESRARTKQVFELLNFLMENFVFTYIGVSIFTYTRHSWNAIFIVGTVLAVIVARACNIYPLSFLLNLGRSNKIRYNFQHMMMFSGLRGAVAFALAIRNTSTDQHRLIFSTTLLVVIATVIFCGGFTTQMLQWLKIRVGVEEETDRELQNFEAVRSAMGRQRSYQTMRDNTRTGQEAHVSPSEPQPPAEQPSSHRLYEKAWLVLKWYNIDAKFVKPLLTHARPPLTETLPRCCLPLAKLLTTDQQLTQTEGSHRPYEDSDTDLIIDEQELSYGDHNNVSQTPNSNSTSQSQPTETGIEVPSEFDLDLGDSTTTRISAYDPELDLESDSVPLLNNSTNPSLHHTGSSDDAEMLNA